MQKLSCIIFLLWRILTWLCDVRVTWLCDVRVVWLCEFVHNFTWLKCLKKSHSSLRLVATGLGKVKIRFLICHVTSSDHVIKVLNELSNFWWPQAWWKSRYNILIYHVTLHDHAVEGSCGFMVSDPLSFLFVIGFVEKYIDSFSFFVWSHMTSWSKWMETPYHKPPPCQVW